MLPDYRSIALLVHAGAGSGLGGRVAAQVAQGIHAVFADAKLEIIETRSKEHIKEFGRTTEADLIVCLSGDGSLHDIAQSLVRRAEGERPTLVPIPAGSGNDYARTLGLPLDPLKAAVALAECRPFKVDVGCVNSTFFLETLSFGMDAAVAIKTEELRLATKARGFLLYTHAAIDAIIHDFAAHKATVRMDDREFSCDTIIFAVQNGPTYGGGYQVAPHASIVDGMLDVYIITGVNRPAAIYYLTQIKTGKHERLKGVSYHKTSHLQLEFAEQVPAQCDGEQLLGLTFDISVLPGALDVLAVPSAYVR
ncbi:MAG: diacylglycerol kinase family lipid kinase [Coriobacteriales bacterium]|nr:diacylglycerol kinase family lipid kinase [Coriobacteriales bacterium]